MIRIAKRNYYDNRFSLAKNSLKETWKLINEVINKPKRTQTSFPPNFNNGSKILTDPLEIANGFCDYFTNVGPNLAKRIPVVCTSFTLFLSDRTKDSLFLYPTNNAELTNICQSLN